MAAPTPAVKALCCVCGSVRECRRARNRRGENYWFARPIDLDWHRETGELKCTECGRITTHALLHPEGDRMRDHAELMQRIATGDTHSGFTDARRAEVAAKYRQGLPRNPELFHRWWVGEAQAAWDAGRRTVNGLCGEPMTIHRDPSGRSASRDCDDDRQIKPMRVRDQEYEDEQAGLWWTELDCVDCLRVWHLELLRQRRNDLTGRLAQLLADLRAEDKNGHPKRRFDLQTVNALIDALDDAEPTNAHQSEDGKAAR